LLVAKFSRTQIQGPPDLGTPPLRFSPAGLNLSHRSLVNPKAGARPPPLRCRPALDHLFFFKKPLFLSPLAPPNPTPPCRASLFPMNSLLPPCVLEGPRAFFPRCHVCKKIPFSSRRVFEEDIGFPPIQGDMHPPFYPSSGHFTGCVTFLCCLCLKPSTVQEPFLKGLNRPVRPSLF